MNLRRFVIHRLSVHAFRAWSRRATLLCVCAGLWLGVGDVGRGTVRADEPRRDVVIYAATSAGITAAISATRMGASVTLIEPTGRVGGLTTGGLGQTDIGNKAAIGGLARDFYRAVKRHYAEASAWKWQAARPIGSAAVSRPSQWCCVITTAPSSRRASRT